MAVLTQDQLKKLRESGLNDNEISSLAQKNGFTMPTTTPSKVLSSNEVFSLKKQGLNDTEISTLAQKNNIGLPEQNQDGFFKSTLKDVAKTLLVKPAIRTAQALAAVPVYTFGSDATKQRYQEQIAKDVKVPFTGITVEGQRKFDEGGATQIASDALKSASYLYGGQGTTKAVGGLVKGKIAQPIATGALTGAVGGATYGAGEEMVNPEATIGSTLKSGAVGGVAGGVLGGAIPAIGAGVKPSYKIVKDTAGKAKMLFATPEDKALYVVNKRTEELSNIVNKSSPLKKLVTSAESQGYNPIKDLSDSDLLVGAVNKDGRIDGKLVQERFNEVMDVPEGIIKKKFEETGEKISLDQVQARMAEVLNSDYVPSKIYKQVQNKYDDIVYGLYQKGKVDADGMVKFADLQQEKIDAYKLSNFLDPEKTMGDKAIGRAFKNVIDQDSKSIPELEQINKELGRYLSVKSLIDKLDQKVVKGGRLGKYFAQGIGAIAGQSVGGPLGGIVGAEVGGKIQGQILKGTFGKAVGKDIFEGSLETLKNQSNKVDALQIPQANTINATKNVISKSIPLNKKSSQAGFISTGGKGNTLYHGTNADFKEFDISKSKTGQFGRGIYATDNIESAKKYGKKVLDIPMKDNKYIDIKDIGGVKGYTEMAKKIYKENTGKTLKIDRGNLSSGFDDWYYLKEVNSNSNLDVKDMVNRELEKMGYSGIKIPQSNGENTYVVFSQKNISKDLQPLYKEAQKYKSAEEFVKKNDPIDFYKVRPNKIGNMETGNYVNVSFFPKEIIKGQGITKSRLLDLMKDWKKEGYSRITPYQGNFTQQGRGFIDTFIRDGYLTKDLRFTDKVNKIKTKSQLEQIWKEANSKTSTKQGMTAVNPLTVGAGVSAVGAGAMSIKNKNKK